MRYLSDSEKKLLRGARLTDYLEAYIKYMPEHASQYDETINSFYDLLCLLQLNLSEPSEYSENGPGEKAFAYIRTNILTRKINFSLSEKQKLYMEENSILFLQSLNRKQASLYREFNKYRDYLK